jgi:hypothetical protein
MQTHTDSCCGLISKGRLSDFKTLRMNEANAVFALHNLALLRLNPAYAGPPILPLTLAFDHAWNRSTRHQRRYGARASATSNVTE